MAEEKEKRTSKKWEKYTIDGDSAKGAKTCPKCGPGVFLAEHKDRWACGKCGYMEKKPTTAKEGNPEGPKSPEKSD